MPSKLEQDYHNAHYDIGHNRRMRESAKARGEWEVAEWHREQLEKATRDLAIINAKMSTQK
jgi:hypothetical protein